MGDPQHSRCVQRNCARISDAVSIFSQRDANGEIPLVLIPGHRSAFAGTGWWLTIPSGVSCLMQKWGRHCEIAKPGGSISPPWYRIAYIVTQQSCTYNAPVKMCPTADNVRVGVDCVIVFSIRSPEDFVYKLGAVHFNHLLSGAVEEGIRVLVRGESHQTVRKLRGNRADHLLSLLNKKFDVAGVTFSSCTITAITLPAALESSLERTTELGKAMARTRREHTFQLGEIQRKSDFDLEELKRKNEQSIVMETGKKKRAELMHEQLMVKQDELDSTAGIEAQQASQAKLIEVKAELERTKVNVEKSRVETISKAEADAESRRVEADIGYEKALMNAEARKAQLMGEAEAVRLDAEAEAAASQHLTHKRRHELEMREKEVILSLAQRSSYNLIGEPGDRLVDALLTGHLEGASPNTSAGWFKSA